jgi:hypothetical protein
MYHLSPSLVNEKNMLENSLRCHLYPSIKILEFYPTIFYVSNSEDKGGHFGREDSIMTNFKIGGKPIFSKESAIP